MADTTAERSLAPVTTDQIAAGTIETRKIGIFLLVTFAISWTVGLVIHLTGGLSTGPSDLSGGLRVTLLTMLYMFGPTVGNGVTRIVTGEGTERLFVRPRFLQNWRWYLFGWLGVFALVMAGGGLYYLSYPAEFDPQLRSLTSITGQVPIDPVVLFGIVVIAALTINTAITMIATFGEEFGWRGYLVPKLLPLGNRRAIVLSGIVWGVWHWPLTVQGHNYPGTPILGALLMVYFTTVVGAVFAWIALRGESVWPAVIGHAVLNSTAGLVVFFDVNTPEWLVGPVVTGVVGSIPFALLAGWLLSRESSFAIPTVGTDQS